MIRKISLLRTEVTIICFRAKYGGGAEGDGWTGGLGLVDANCYV